MYSVSDDRCLKARGPVFFLFDNRKNDSSIFETHRILFVRPYAMANFTTGLQSAKKTKFTTELQSVADFRSVHGPLTTNMSREFDPSCLALVPFDTPPVIPKFPSLWSVPTVAQWSMLPYRDQELRAPWRAKSFGISNRFVARLLVIRESHRTSRKLLLLLMGSCPSCACRASQEVQPTTADQHPSPLVLRRLCCATMTLLMPELAPLSLFFSCLALRRCGTCLRSNASIR